MIYQGSFDYSQVERRLLNNLTRYQPTTARSNKKDHLKFAMIKADKDNKKKDLLAKMYSHQKQNVSNLISNNYITNIMPYFPTQTTTNFYPQYVAASSTYVNSTTTATITTASALMGSLSTQDIEQLYNTYVLGGQKPPVRKLLLGEEFEAMLPDGGVFKLSKDGQYQLDDKNAKITYQANRHRDFNKYLNGSDLLEEFVDFCKKETTVNRSEFLNFPVELFIRWMVIRAAEADQEDVDYGEVKTQLAIAKSSNTVTETFTAQLKSKCKSCGRFLSKKRVELGIAFCSPQHLGLYESRFVDA